jgi:hypothetical protein
MFPEIYKSTLCRHFTLCINNNFNEESKVQILLWACSLN